MNDFIPKVSVVMPIRNEEKNIVNALHYVVNQNYPQEKMEILIVDGMSCDGTRSAIDKFFADVKRNKDILPNFRLLDNPNGQRAVGLNVGIRESIGDIIVRVDARSVIPSDYIGKCVEALRKVDVDNVGGVQKPIIQFDADDFLSSPILTQVAIGAALSHSFGVGNAQFRIGSCSGYVDSVYLGCFRKDIFDKVGLFDEESIVLSEDADMNYRIRKSGGKVYFNKDIVVYYHPRDNLKDLWRMYFRYGGSRAGFFLKRYRLTSWRQFIPLAFLLALIFLPIAGLYQRAFFYLWFVMIVVYLLLDCIVSLHSALKNKRITVGGIKTISLSLKHRTSVFFRLFLVFPIMHISWALGFLKRILQKPRNGKYWRF